MPSVSSRFRMRAVVGLACLLATCALRAQDAGTEVAIPDDGLRCAVTEALGKAPDEAVSQDEMATLAELSSTCDQAIVDLTGLDYASGLQILKLPGNAIVDLDPLSDLANLLLLELKDNDIVDIAPLSGLTALGTLDLSGNAISEHLQDLREAGGNGALELGVRRPPGCVVRPVGGAPWLGSNNAPSDAIPSGSAGVEADGTGCAHQVARLEDWR